MRNPGGLRNHYVAFLQNMHGMGLVTDPTKHFICLILNGKKGHFTHMAEVTCPYGMMPLKTFGFSHINPYWYLTYIMFRGCLICWTLMNFKLWARSMECHAKI